MAEMIHTKNRGDYLPLEENDLTAVLDMTVQSLKKHGCKAVKYDNTEQGLQAFTDRSIEFLEYVSRVNQDSNLDKKIIPDVEAWCVYMGFTRMTLSRYRSRGGEWAEVIDQVKAAIMAAKKQLALTYKIPPMVFVFDAVNNHGYVNSSEFKLTAKTETETKQMSADAIADRAAKLLEMRGESIEQEFENADNLL